MGDIRVFFFFFQAEDGIRDDLVTGVQTCALPISRGSGSRAGPCPRCRRRTVRRRTDPRSVGGLVPPRRRSGRTGSRWAPSVAAELTMIANITSTPADMPDTTSTRIARIYEASTRPILPALRLLDLGTS